MTHSQPYSSYREYLAHPIFVAIRREVMIRAGWICEACRMAEATAAHHRVYPAWGTFDRPEFLLAVCHPCHCKIHGKEN